MTAGGIVERHLLRLTLPALLLVLACGEDSPTAPSGSGPERGVAVPDFSIPDVNPTSARFREMVSPRDYLQSVSAWYFGHAT
jgi:hypothetical protein